MSDHHIRPFDSEEELLPLVDTNRYCLFTTIRTNDLSGAHRNVCTKLWELKHG